MIGSGHLFIPHFTLSMIRGTKRMRLFSIVIREIISISGTATRAQIADHDLEDLL